MVRGKYQIQCYNSDAISHYGHKAVRETQHVHLRVPRVCAVFPFVLIFSSEDEKPRDDLEFGGVTEFEDSSDALFDTDDLRDDGNGWEVNDDAFAGPEFEVETLLPRPLGQPYGGSHSPANVGSVAVFFTEIQPSGTLAS